MRVLGYARVSSLEQASGTSLQDQQDAIKAYAASRGLAVHRFYVEAESGVHERAEMRVQIQLLLKEARCGDLVVCDKLDRWSRDPEFTYGSIRRLLETGVSFYAVGDRCDPSTRDGDTMLGVRVLVAREEHKRIKERTVGTRRLLRDKGYYVEGTVPIGYERRASRDRLAHNILHVVENQAEAVKEVYRACIHGWSISKISKTMQQKYPWRRWDKKLVNKILRNRLYLGEIQDSRGIWIKGQHEAVIEPGLFARVQIALDGRRNHAGKRDESRTRNWLIREIGRCAQCQAKLSSSYGRWREEYTYYYRCLRGCPGYMRVEHIDGAVSNLTIDRLVELREELAKGPEPRERPIKDFAAERKKLQAKRERYLETFADGNMTKPELQTALRRVDEVRTRLDAQEAEQVRTVSAGAMRATLARVENIRLAWWKADRPVRRQILHELATAVLASKGKEPVVKWRTVEEILMNYA
jgi:DNA invertase Pin-like site-specific DNA recombinase